ncbi:hypothetical protein DL240_18465 [Lujinxingia litoralis]|uniref:Cytochrome P450 n=1 Tax=Lujinxingia litoralis TaxID=2211119 RepID=A0A328C4G9_9DELT|nr:cytochrome P450 [Lujinxingia litoralis]RAL20202.1 hypothetical protein DL240_18465 [Lujinxingia litoralis]
MRLRPLFYALAHPLVYAMVPLKTLAFTTRFTFLRGLLLEFTAFMDVLLVGLLVQNHALRLTAKAFGGNFIFGRTLMETDHSRAAAALMEPHLRGNLFMGLPIVGFAPTVFMTNAGPINVSQPARGVLRGHLDAMLQSDALRHPDLDATGARVAHALHDWVQGPRPLTLWALRGAATRVLAILLADVDLPQDQARTITAAYLRRFAELSAFYYYAPWMLSLLGTHEAMRHEVFLPLKRHGINALVVDMMLFAGMFSVGTIVMKCVDFARDYDIDYPALSPTERQAFVVESLRLFPTVSSVHRVVENPEPFELRGRTITARPGMEIAYPFVCIHQNADLFPQPERLRLDRPGDQVANILSWSRGPHQCPLRDLSVVVTTLMLDALAESHGDLRQLHIANIEV